MYKMVFSPFAQEPCKANGGKTTKLSILGRVYCSRWGRSREGVNTGRRREGDGNEAGKICPWMCCSHGGPLTRSIGSEEILIRKEGPRLGHLLCVLDSRSSSVSSTLLEFISALQQEHAEVSRMTPFHSRCFFYDIKGLP